MIKSVTVTNYRNESLLLELANPFDTGIAITNITGIGPSKANINTTDLATSDGSIFNSSRVNSRNIVFTCRLLEDPETELVETTRQRVYKYFPLKRMLRLLFETDNRIAAIEGYVESDEPDIFKKEETIQISIVCPSPYFYSYDQTIVMNGVESLFYFPFSNESLTENEIVFGNIVSSVSSEFIYNGDVDSGVIFRIHANNIAHNITVYNATTRERMDIDTSVIATITQSETNHLITGDDIFLSTLSGDKYIYLVRSGVQYNILPALPKITDWIRIIKGSNVFGYLAEFGKENVSIDINATILYEGV